MATPLLDVGDRGKAAAADGVVAAFPPNATEQVPTWRGDSRPGTPGAPPFWIGKPEPRRWPARKWMGATALIPPAQSGRDDTVENADVQLRWLRRDTKLRRESESRLVGLSARSVRATPTDSSRAGRGDTSQPDHGRLSMLPVHIGNCAARHHFLSRGALGCDSIRSRLPQMTQQLTRSGPWCNTAAWAARI